MGMATDSGQHTWGGIHRLKCRHVIGHGVQNYKMDCDVLGYTNSGKAKVRVYGERNWSGRDHKTRIRYVEPHRLVSIAAAPDRVAQAQGGVQ